MKHVSKIVLSVLFLFVGTLTTHAYTINDNYIGANPTGNYPQYETADVIGDPNIFQVHGMDVGFNGSGNSLSSVKIYTNYVSPITDIGASGTTLGDLFISTNGYTSGDSKLDTWSTGERWEYALVFDNHDPATNTGNLSLYRVNYDNGTNVQLTSAPSGYIYREQQETRINTSLSQYYLGSIGTWTIDATNGILEFLINGNSYLTGNEFGFHWNMTCGNDTIEGGASAPVPEPSTFLLLGAGLLGLGLYGRRRIKS